MQTKESIIKKYEKLNTGLKSAFTRKYNTINKTSIKRQKTKMPAEAQVRYDEEGNVIEEILSEEDESIGSSEKIEALNGPTKAKKGKMK